MNNTNGVIIRDNCLELLKRVLSVAMINRSASSILKDFHKYFNHGGDPLDNICRILKSWGIGANYLPMGIDMLGDIPCPSIVLLDANTIDSQVGHFEILIDSDAEEVRLLEPNSEARSYDITLQALQPRWSGIVIALELDGTKDERGYTRKVKIEKEQLRNAGGVSILMPVFNQAAFATAAFNSLQCQSFRNWELIVIDDGSQDGFEDVIAPFLKNEKIRYYRNDRNEGLGYSLNKGIDLATYDMIAYLPADDIYYKEHLETLVKTLVTTGASMVYSGVLHHFSYQWGDNYGVKSFGKIDDYPLQLVQVLHLKINERWMERSELVTDDLHKMYWNKFLNTSAVVLGTQQVTCEWVDHAKQRHKIINDRIGGGIYLYKKTYGVSEPIRFQSSVGNLVDEIKHYDKFRKREPLPSVESHSLKILLVGELAYNPERIYALEQKGHKLYGLWIENPANFNTVGPLPFGSVEDIPLKNWKQRVDEIQPDIIYALLNYHAVPLAYQVLIQNPGIPFVWHFKEGPFFCRSFGTWNQLINLYSKSDGQIYTNVMTYEWFKQYVPGQEETTFILDGDLPKIDWFTENRSPLLSEKDGEIHTVIAGRPVGLQPGYIKRMADQKIHLHLYGDIFHSQFKEMLDVSKRIAPDYLHLHTNCAQKDWVTEFSQYDAGWLHFFKSENCGDISKASWHDLNLPARVSTYAIAGLPMLVRDNKGHRVACQEILDHHEMALTFGSFEGLREILGDKERLRTVRHNVWAKRHLYSFDYYVDDLIGFFKKIIDKKRGQEKSFIS